MLSSTDVQRLERAAGERPADAEAVWQRTQPLRARVERILLALVAGQRPADDDVDALNADLAPVLSARQLIPADGGYRWAWGDRGGDDLDRLLWFVLLSVADVLTTKDHRRVRRCAGEGCDLLFVDRAPGSPRKWCSMKSCGHRVNARRHYYTKVKPDRKESWERVRAREQAQALEWARKRAQTAGPDDPSGEG